jgi:hypothetical protein
MQTYQEHELSKLLPMMEESDLGELAADISLNGLRAPITLFEGKILDGRNRYKACHLVKVAPRFRDLIRGYCASSFCKTFSQKYI